MTDTTQDDLTRPLKAAKGKGAKASGKPGLMSRLPLMRVALGFTASVGLAVLLYAALVHDPFGGEPHAVSVIVPRAIPDPIAEAPAAAPRGPATAGDLERQAGVTVVRPGANAPGSIVISVGDGGPVRLNPAPDPRIAQQTRFGIAPRMGADGLRAMDVYARPVVPLPGGASPKGRIAVVVGGLGISQSATADALARLPRAVTLAFAPYGAELERNVTEARAAGHEVMLQAPMEPFDYPDNDPGPHTLMATGKPAETAERLAWLFGRFPGYVGIVNFMGARLTAEEAAMTPILREIGGRGLFFLDDGSSPRSVATATADKLRVPARKADVVVDATLTPAAIDAALARLERQATEKGLAIGSASALPLTVDRLARWSQALEAKGILLVPVSSAWSTP